MIHPFCCSLLLALLLLGFCACGQGSYPSTLLRADSLASVAPDSARVLLARWADSAGHAPERVRMYHRLLTIKAADKAYVRHTSDSLIKKVVAYYEDGGDKSLLPEAYYYAGRVYRDLGDAPQALDYFERAADALPPRGQEVLAGKIYSQTGTLFLYQQMYEEALEMFLRAYAYDVKAGDVYDVKAGDVRGQVFALRDITNVYQRMEKLDSTLAYIQKAHVLASECGNVDMLSLVQGQRLSLYLQLQKYDSAEVCLREAFKHVHKAIVCERRLNMCIRQTIAGFIPWLPSCITIPVAWIRLFIIGIYWWIAVPFMPRECLILPWRRWPCVGRTPTRLWSIL